MRVSWAEISRLIQRGPVAEARDAAHAGRLSAIIGQSAQIIGRWVAGPPTATGDHGSTDGLGSRRDAPS